MSDNQELDNKEFAFDRLKRYYRILKIIKDEMQGEEEIKLKLMEAVSKH